MRTARQSLAYRKLVVTAKQLAKAGVQAEPKWLQALERCPPEPESPAGKGKPRPLEFPEDRFIQSFYDRFPHVRQMPMDLHSKEPPLARQYALRALKLWQDGRTPKQARRIADQEFQAAGLLAPREDSSGPALRHIQLEEEQSLQRGMSMMIGQK